MSTRPKSTAWYRRRWLVRSLLGVFLLDVVAVLVQYPARSSYSMVTDFFAGIRDPISFNVRYDWRGTVPVLDADGAFTAHVYLRRTMAVGLWAPTTLVERATIGTFDRPSTNAELLALARAIGRADEAHDRVPAEAIRAAAWIIDGSEERVFDGGTRVQGRTPRVIWTGWLHTAVALGCALSVLGILCARTLAWRADGVAANRRGRGLCPRCEYDVRNGLELCPECGASVR